MHAREFAGSSLTPSQELQPAWDTGNWRPRRGCRCARLASHSRCSTKELYERNKEHGWKTSRLSSKEHDGIYPQKIRLSKKGATGRTHSVSSLPQNVSMPEKLLLSLVLKKLTMQSIVIAFVCSEETNMP